MMHSFSFRTGRIPWIKNLIKSLCLACLHEVDRRGRAELEVVRNDVLATPCRQVAFSHLDIAACNGTVAILDREMAGWMLEQWEYLKAMGAV